MTFRAHLIIIGCFIFCLFIQFLALLAGIGWAMVAAVVIAAALLLLLQFFEVNLPYPWLGFVLPLCSGAAGVGLGFLRGVDDWAVWWAPLITGTVAGLWIAVRARYARRCSLCNSWLSPSEIVFECPRCQLMVCERTCWEFEHLRCVRCEENHVPVFLGGDRWWDRQLGVRVDHGRCQICMKASEEADLRCCGKCGRPQCRDCWDYVNGQCSRCDWIIPDLPEKLRPYMLHSVHPKT
jgi:hypothetical protein